MHDADETKNWPNICSNIDKINENMVLKPLDIKCNGVDINAMNIEQSGV